MNCAISQHATQQLGVAKILRGWLDSFRRVPRSRSTAQLRAVGRTEITELARWFLSTLPDLKIIMDDLRLQEDCAEYYWTLIGTNSGPGGTTHRVRISGFEKWTMGADGLIASSQGRFDAAEYQRQLEHRVQD